MTNAEVIQRMPTGTPGHELGQVLSQERRQDGLISATEPWKRFYEPWQPENEYDCYAQWGSITRSLSIEAESLRKCWSRFQDQLPQEEQVDLRDSEPSVNGLVEMVDILTKARQTQKEQGWSGKTIAFFRRFCSTLHSHKAFIKIVPEGSEYVSLFAGTLTVIIKASANYDNIARGLAKALCVISEHVVECEFELKLYPTEGMQAAVADFYAHIFLFLEDTMKWHMQKRYKRLLRSFNEDFFKKFEDQILNIKDKSEIIRRKFGQSLAAEHRVTRLTVEQTGQDIRLGLTGIQRGQADMARRAEQFATEMEEAKRDRNEQHDRHMRELQRMPWLQHLVAVGQTEEAICSRDEVIINSKNLEDYFSRNRVRLRADLVDSMMIDQEILIRLTEWTKASNAGLLSIAGPNTDVVDHDNPTTAMAANFIDIVARSQVPVVSYFCELQRGTAIREGHTREIQGTVALMYALIRQMVELLLPQFDCHLDFSPERFDRLNGSTQSWEETMSLFNELLEMMPDWLDDRSTARYLKDLVVTLRRSRLKVLITTTGRSRCLLAELPDSELLLMDEQSTSRGGEVMDEWL
ncbi:hypothetical protein K490DRAFT_70314 [Saccharata proteae CBS 121410]|uniref:DUF7708 domain-containing protein n=1 Tax=Saccharata proteae CBS 121410 TaxID=1314787 RepID=A0A9P4I1J8_9PEZI|nr:hypothetical protein K490DRAFT_70314 [Saccharata proteae CBS 121410]